MHLYSNVFHISLFYSNNLVDLLFYLIYGYFFNFIMITFLHLYIIVK